MIAVRDNEDMAAASTVSPNRIKVISFTVSGGIAALAGCLLITVREQVTPTQAFTPEESLRVVATAVIGGLGSIAGPVHRRAVGARPAGAVQRHAAGAAVHEQHRPADPVDVLPRRPHADRVPPARRRARRGPNRGSPIAATPNRCRRSRSGFRPEAPRPSRCRRRRPWLSVRDVSVRFGGNHAVDQRQPRRARGRARRVDRHQRRRQVDADERDRRLRAGSTGTVELLGRDVSRPARRTAGTGSGSAAGFQAARLFPALTVRETIMVALEARERSWLVPSMTGLPPSPSAERRKRAEASELIDFLGLGRYADEFVVEPLDRHPPDRRARHAARRRRTRAAARRTDRWRRAA